MMHSFIFNPGVWLGEGNVSLINSPSQIHFYTKWEVVESKTDLYEAVQMVEIPEEEKLINHYVFDIISSEKFNLTLENELVGKIFGNGYYDDKLIKWEFTANDIMNGNEVYERQDNGNYLFRAEFGTDALYRTIISGTVWKSFST